jgi:hypothetical protein
VSAGSDGAQKGAGARGQSNVAEDPDDVCECALTGPRRAQGGRS